MSISLFSALVAIGSVVLAVLFFLATQMTDGEEPSAPSERRASTELRAFIQARVAELGEPRRLELRKQRRALRVADFSARLQTRWAGALDSLEELIATCAELGDRVAQAHGDDSRLFTVLELLRSRAVQIGWEVHGLASAGYADGAYARWRTLHEVAVVSEFLKKFGEETAARYLDHVHVKNRKVVREYNKCQARLGYPRIPQSEVDRSEDLKNQTVSRYEPAFANDLGWAVSVLKNENPNLADLREAADYGHWKAHSGMANHPVHAGPHGVLFRLGHPITSGPRPLSGPSLVGLGTAIDAASITLMHATFSFVFAIRQEAEAERESDFGLENTANVQFIADLARKVAEQVVEASEHIEREFGK